jgi:putative hydrolase of the HAD superfamily
MKATTRCTSPSCRNCSGHDSHEEYRHRRIGTLLPQVKQKGWVGSIISCKREAVFDKKPRNSTIRAVLWDFGGVILTSPFDAFARYEATNGLPTGFIRSINATNPDTNAWAKFERTEVSFDDFCVLFEAEAANLGHVVDARDVMGLLDGELRPQMVAALHSLKSSGYLLGLLTNNVVSAHTSPTGNEKRLGTHGRDEVIALFDCVVESSVVGFRKPEPAFYVAACEGLSVQPAECVFLDDLGINLKPAAIMGMHTIKVGDPDVALTALAEKLGHDLGAQA